MKAPCKDCKNRSPTCHSECEAYIAFAKEREVIRAERLSNYIIHRNDSMLASMEAQIKFSQKQKRIRRKHDG